ncbi:CopY family transcriptional repressor [Caulobacter mirabilis]|uniref:CopY family transcriptional repressor n=2 Tax=Caulobacter mirabilis TaxID=69666 RepID=A0A2D2AYF8_9CAUL|nr:CopY family transcriptional repressor [Caulobacter mirabilis]
MADTPQPSEAELELLKILWRDGPASAREIQARLPEGLAWAASTTRTVLERMRAKGLLNREEVHGVAVYAAAAGKTQVLGGVLRRLVRGVLEVDGPLPASAFSGSQVLNEAELEELTAVLNADLEKDR